MLAFSGIGAPAAIAQEPEEITEGTAEVVDGGAEPSSDVDVELSGDELQLSDEAPAAAPPPASEDDDGPLEQELATEIHGSAVDTTEDAEAVAPDEVPSIPEEVAPTPDQLAPTPDQPAPAQTEPVPAPTPPAQPVVVNEDPGPVAIATERRGQRKSVERARTRPVRPAPAPLVAEPAPVVVEPAPVVAAEPAPARTVRVVARSSVSRADEGDRLHTVQPGESLWSIASDRLGGRASVGRIAREVNRLWELNDERIGTGRPDLLFAGTRLRLR